MRAPGAERRSQPFLARDGFLLQAIQGVVTRGPELAGCSLADLPSAVSRSVARNAPSRLVSATGPGSPRYTSDRYLCDKFN